MDRYMGVFKTGYLVDPAYELSLLGMMGNLSIFFKAALCQHHTWRHQQPRKETISVSVPSPHPAVETPLSHLEVQGLVDPR